MNTATIRKYKIADKSRSEELVRICWQYRAMLDEMDSLATSAPSMDGLPHGTGISDPTHAAAVRRERLRERIRAIERCAHAAGGDCYKGLLLGVTTRGSSYEWLRINDNIFCGRNQYYGMRSKFFWLLDREL